MQDKTATSPRHIRIEASDGSGSFNGYLALPRSGSGPGFVLLQEIFGVNQTMRDVADYYAEEGYVVLVPDLFWRQQPGIELGYARGRLAARPSRFYQRFDAPTAIEDIAGRDRRRCARVPEVQRQGRRARLLPGRQARLPRGLPAPMSTAPSATTASASTPRSARPARSTVPAGRCTSPSSTSSRRPRRASRIMAALRRPRRTSRSTSIPASTMPSPAPGGDHYHKPSALMAHSRAHRAVPPRAWARTTICPRCGTSTASYEFATRDVDATMATMVAEPYVNHIPTMTGGVGYDELHALLHAPLHPDRRRRTPR